MQYVYDGYGVTGSSVTTPAPPQAAANTKGNKGKNGNSGSPQGGGASAPGIPHYSTFGYRGQLTDKTGLQFLRHRYYDPAGGVFLTQDPIQDGINWYGYAGGDPVNRWDPSGLVDLTHYTAEQLAQKRQAEIWAFEGMGEAVVDTAAFAGKFLTPAIIYFGPTEGPEMAKNIGTGLWKTTELVAPFLGPGVPMFGHHTTESLRAHQEAQKRSAAVMSALWTQFATKMQDPEYANRLAGYVTAQIGIDILSGVAIAKFVKYLDELDELAATAKLFDKLDDAPGGAASGSGVDRLTELQMKFRGKTGSLDDFISEGTGYTSGLKPRQGIKNMPGYRLSGSGTNRRWRSVSTTDDLPKHQRWLRTKRGMQMHHFATNKHGGYFTPRMERITQKYGLSLDGSWNKRMLPHSGRHTHEYHRWVLRRMIRADRAARGNKAIFLEKFNANVIEPVVANPSLLYQ